MVLENRLTELVDTRGVDVLGDPAEFRAALDDYLTDEEITPGDRNVLVDAVRLGAVRRLIALLDQGGDPHSAVSEAGIALARERGSDDARRSLRATALLGFAAGRIDAQVLRSFEVVGTPPPPPNVPGPTAVLAPTRAASPGPPTSSAGAEGAGRRGRWPIVVGIIGVLVILAAVGGWWFLLRGETPEEGLEKWFAARSCEAAAERMTGAAAEEIQTEIDAGDESGLCEDFAEYASDYNVSTVDERGDRATIEVEGTQHYDGSDDSIAKEQDFSATFDLRLVDGEWLVSNVQWTYVDQ